METIPIYSKVTEQRYAATIAARTREVIHDPRRHEIHSISNNMKIAIIGGGAIGLRTALTLYAMGLGGRDEEGKSNITVFYDTDSSNTASGQSAGFWYEFQTDAQEGALEQTYKMNLVVTHIPGSGAYEVPALELRVTSMDQYNHGWEKYAQEYRTANEEDLLSGKRIYRINNQPHRFTYGSHFLTQQYDMQTYMSFMRDYLTSRGVIFMQRKIDSIGDLYQDHKLVVLNAGLQSRDLIDDEFDIHPALGELITFTLPKDRLPQEFQSGRIIMSEENIARLTYVTFFPVGEDEMKCIMGGTYEPLPYVNFKNNSYRQPTRKSIMKIWNRNLDMVPELGQIEYSGIQLRAYVAARPARSGVREEIIVPGSGNALSVNFGHGGGGAATILDGFVASNTARNMYWIKNQI